MFSLKPFLKKLFAWLAPSAADKQATFDFVSQEGEVARFIFEKRKIRADGIPRPAAFEPELHPETSIFETSVCGLNNVANERLWTLGCTIRKDKAAIAAAVVHVPKIVLANLACRAAPEENYPEHGVIVGWNDDKSIRLAALQALAADTIRTMHPTQDCSNNIV